MRVLCTVSAPLPACASPASVATATDGGLTSSGASRPLPPGARFLALHLVGGSTLYFIVESKSRVREVYAQTCLHFATQGMLDTELFGLAVICGGEYLFADPDSKLSKYGPKSWRSSHTHGLDANGRPLLELYFRVQFYVESPLLLRDEITRHYYYLQLKDNASCRQCGSNETAAALEQVLLFLGGLALQADYGDSIEDQIDYFKPEDYAPQGLRNAWGVSALQACHRDNGGLSKQEAELLYIREAATHQDSINCHLFRMRAIKAEVGKGSVWLSVCPNGIKVAPEHGNSSFFTWPSIGKLSFDKKKFEIRSGENKLTLYSCSDDKSKLLLALCRESHQFSMKIAPKLSEIIRRDEEERKCFRDVFMYSRALNLPPYKSKSDQRISVISSTSSNTTSGIVSDRVHSEDELEIMINSPPAPSTESLAFAHLLDTRSQAGSICGPSPSSRPGVSRQASSVGQVSLKDLEDTLAALSVHNEAAEGPHFASRSASSAGSIEQLDRKCDRCDRSKVKPGKCTGSQCSSNCSTVVVAEATTPIVPPAPRRSSTASSLELGYSHTAQNSALSEAASTCIGLDYATHALEEAEEGSTSGLYTMLPNAASATSETSGVYTMGSSEMTGQSSEIAHSDITHSESHESLDYGSFRPQNDDQSIASGRTSYRTNSSGNDSSFINHRLENADTVDGMNDDDFRRRLDSDTMAYRPRACSNVSTSGSFHGDGSDPSDKKHALLTAEELSDLIVGRGTYPNRQTVSHTLDTDSDYVTLPLPLEGDSYLQGHEDTAPTDEIYPEIDDEFLMTPQKPPTPPTRTDASKEPYTPDIVAAINSEMFHSPPPYNARHETVKPPLFERKSIAEVKKVQELKEAALGIPLRDPPPYPSAVPPPPTYPEEAAARFITTKPHINILTAHASSVNTTAEASFSAPAVSNIQHITVPSNIGIPVVPYTLPHRSSVSYQGSMPHYQQSRLVAPSYPEQMHQIQTTSYLEHGSYPTAVLVPVAKQRQYLPPPPPPMIPRQPPPPPPGMATVYTSQVARSQIEQYQQQLYSDVDYVIYPLQDPAISKQEYLDSKHLAAMAHSPPPPPPPYPAYPKSHMMYRSTPYLNVTYAPHARYASTQNLSDTYVQLPAGYSPMYSPASYSSSSTHSLRYEPPPPPPHRPQRTLPGLPVNNFAPFARTRSDDNILNSIETQTKFRRIPPPPPPYEHKKRLTRPPMPVPQTPEAHLLTKSQTNPAEGAGPIDIRTLREKSKNLDLPLISALCNDRSLLKQTKAFVMPKHPNLAQSSQSSTKPSLGTSSKLKYPVSGLSSMQISKPPRRSSASHRHPNDKLPALPGHPNFTGPAPDTLSTPRTTTTGNNYVLNGPGSTPTTKLKSVHS